MQWRWYLNASTTSDILPSTYEYSINLQHEIGIDNYIALNNKRISLQCCNTRAELCQCWIYLKNAWECGVLLLDMCVMHGDSHHHLAKVRLAACDILPYYASAGKTSARVDWRTMKCGLGIKQYLLRVWTRQDRTGQEEWWVRKVLALRPSGPGWGRVLRRRHVWPSESARPNGIRTGSMRSVLACLRHATRPFRKSGN